MGARKFIVPFCLTWYVWTSFQQMLKIQCYSFGCQNGKHLNILSPLERKCSAFFWTHKTRVKFLSFSSQWPTGSSSFIFLSKDCVYKQAQLAISRFRIYLGVWFPGGVGGKKDSYKSQNYRFGKLRARREIQRTELVAVCNMRHALV